MKKSVVGFILGSSSPRRIELLKIQGYRFKIIKPDIAEISHHHETSIHVALANSRAKAVYLSEKNKNGIILSADTIVVVGGQILGKPKNKKQSLLMLMKLNNKTHSVITAYTILINKNGRIKIIDEKAVESKVTFGKFTRAEYIKYINSCEPEDKAGAYAIQGLGARFIKGFRGSYTNIVGLPVFEVMQGLKKAGVEYPWN
ncbi:MAG: Maf family protein [Proteobacteria bacterium]|nr:Maf family protein [Pseudomonadota bacterium]